jgi:hypothetical protein
MPVTHDDAGSTLDTITGINGVQNGGTGADLSATGPGLLQQATLGAAVTVSTAGTTLIADGAVTNAKLRDSSALSLVGRSANSSGDPADIAATAKGQSLKNVNNALTWTHENVFNVADYGVSSGAAAADNVTNIKAAIAALKAAGGGTLLFPSQLGTFDVAFDDTVTTYYGIFKFVSNMNVKFEVGAKLRVTGTDPGIFSGVFGPDTTALPISRVKFIDCNALDTISGTDTQMVRFITFTPNATMAADSVSDVEIAGGSFTNFASPFLIASRNTTTLGDWEREVSDVRIHDVYATGCISAFATVDGRNISVTNCQAYGDTATPANSVDAISCHAAVGLRVQNNTFGYFANADGITIHVQNSNVAVNGVVKGCRDVMIDGNFIHDTYGSSKAIGISCLADSPLGMTNVTVTNNNIVRAGRGIQINQNGNVGTPFRGFTVTGNYVEAHERGIDVVGDTSTKRVHDINVSNNIIRIVPNGAGDTLAGTVAINADGTTLTGTSTLFQTELADGDWIMVAGHPVKISGAPASDTSATTTAYPGSVNVTGAVYQMLGAGVTAVDSYAMRIQNVERGSVVGNDVLMINGATNARVAFLDSCRHVKFEGNTWYAADASVVSIYIGTTSALTSCSMIGNLLRGDTNFAAGAWTSGYAAGNRFQTTGADFNGVDVGGSKPFEFRGGVLILRGAAIASAGTIAPTANVHHVTGTTAINTITVPSGFGDGQQITLIPDALWTWTTAGNIALAGSAVVGKAVIFTYDATAAKWYPSVVA